MHPEAEAFVANTVKEHWPLGVPFDLWVVEFGSRDVNGSVRYLFPNSNYLGIDASDGPGVDLVMDAADWEPVHDYDVVVSTEVFEHTPRWWEMLEGAALALDAGGLLIVTCATEPRAPHSAVDGFDLKRGEYYQNVNPAKMADVLTALKFEFKIITHERGDLYVKAVK